MTSFVINTLDRPDETNAPADFVNIETTDLVEAVEAQLIHAIVQGRLTPGARIVEADIARRMGISRAPVREAARRLERQGILDARPRHGFTVRAITVEEIDDLYRVRLALETMAIKLACLSADEAGLARLQAIVHAMQNDPPELPQSQRVMRDLEFHTLICELSGNGYLRRLFSNMRTELRMIMALIDLVCRTSPEQAAVTHQSILDSISRRDPEAAARLLEHHLELARKNVRALFLQRHST